MAEMDAAGSRMAIAAAADENGPISKRHQRPGLGPGRPAMEKRESHENP